MNMRPINCPTKMQKLQDDLIRIAERYLGDRDSSFTVKRPVYSKDGPRIRLSYEKKWVRAELSFNAAEYWPTTVFELAHEVVHFLNPVDGYTNYLEEGIAVEFQDFIAPKFSGVKIPVTFPLYLEAQELVRTLCKKPINAAMKIRALYGSLSSVSYSDLKTLFPDENTDLLHKLVLECIPR